MQTPWHATPVFPARSIARSPASHVARQLEREPQQQKVPRSCLRQRLLRRPQQPAGPATSQKLAANSYLSFDSHRHWANRGIALPGSDEFSRKPSANLVIRVPRKKEAQVFAGIPPLIELTQKTFNRIRHIGRRAAIPDRPRNRGKLANASADAEVVGIYHAPILLDLLTFNADVCNPVLSAAIRAACDVQTSALKVRRSSRMGAW